MVRKAGGTNKRQIFLKSYEDFEILNLSREKQDWKSLLTLSLDHLKKKKKKKFKANRWFSIEQNYCYYNDTLGSYNNLMK